MDLIKLAYFRSAARQEHFTRAAQAEHVAQPALSRQIRMLEVELGVPLFDRVGRGVRLSAAGRALLPRVERIMAEIDAIRHDAQALRGLRGGSVALGFLHSIGAHLLPGALAAFRARHPQVNFALHEGSWSLLEERVLRGDLDLAITSPVPAADRALTATTLLRDELMVALPPGHRLAQAEEVRVEQLAAESFIFLAGSFGELHVLTTDACSRAGFRPRVAFEAEGLGTMRGLVGAGLGVALLPALASHVRDEGAPAPVFRRLAGGPVFRMICLVHHAERTLSPAAAAFAEALTSRFRVVSDAD